MRRDGRFRRSLAIVSAVAGLVAVLGLAGPTSASSLPVPHWTTHTQTYTLSKSYSSRALGMCLHVLVTGSIRFDSTPHGAPEQDYDLRNPRLINPEVDVFTQKTCARTSAPSYQATAADLTQDWYAYACDGTIAITVGFPWSVFVGPTGRCGKTKIAGYSTHPHASDVDYYAQYNSGNPVRWREVEFMVKSICLGMSATATVYRGSVSDSVAISGKACGTV